MALTTVTLLWPTLYLHAILGPLPALPVPFSRISAQKHHYLAKACSLGRQTPVNVEVSKVLSLWSSGHSVGPFALGQSTPVFPFLSVAMAAFLLSGKPFYATCCCRGTCHAFTTYTSQASWHLNTAESWPDGKVFCSGSSMVGGVTLKYDTLEGNVENRSPLEIGSAGLCPSDLCHLGCPTYQSGLRCSPT